MRLVDTHCHLDEYEDVSSILEHARERGVEKVLAVAMGVESQSIVLKLARAHREVEAALGVHPGQVGNLGDRLPGVLDFIRKHAKEIAAIGEVGLDHHFVRQRDLWPLQDRVFDEMLSLAEQFELPVTLHVKGAEREAFEALEGRDLPGVAIHWYTGPEDLVKEGVDRGYFFSVTPAVRYSRPMRRTVELTPVEHLLLETDGPVEYQGMPGRPGDVVDVLAWVAEIKGVGASELADVVMANAQTCFPRLVRNVGRTGPARSAEGVG
ncbi:MAG: TatD family hydrolase [Promethearchaeota archaeon]